MKKQVKRLVLTKETVALLMDGQMREAAGGTVTGAYHFSCGSCGARFCEYDPSLSPTACC